VSLDRADALDGVRRHLTAFVDNVAFAEKLLRDGEPVALRWAVTAAFYAALHIVRAYCAAKGVQVSSHVEGEHFFKDHPEVGRVRPTYKALKELSESARYFHQSMQPQHVEQALRKVADVENLVMGRLMKHAPSARDILSALRGTPRG